nr:pilot protein for DNA ejection [Microvirus sp.]
MGWFKKLTGISTGNALNLGAQIGLGYMTGGASLGATGLGSFGGMLNDVLQSQYNQAMQKDMASYNAQMQQNLNDRAFQQNLQMWNLKNAYDSPAAQMQRYKEAGLNPNLIYGQSNTSGSTPELSPATYNAGEYKPVDTKMQRAQLSLAMQEHHQRVTNQAIENDLARQRLVLAARDADRQDALARAQILGLGASLGLTEAKTEDIKNRPQSFLGRNWYDIKKALKEDLGFGNGISPELF